MAIPSAAQVRTYSLSAVFDAVPDAKIDVAVALAARRYAARTAEPSHTEVVALTAAHLLWAQGALAGADPPPGGPVTSASAGGVSASFAVVAPGGDAGDLATSPWGRSALELLDGWIAPLRCG